MNKEKTKQNKKTMKKNLFAILFLFPLWGLGGLFAQTSSVVVTPITANYSATPPTVTFEVSWPAGTRNADHRSKVWLLVDYKRIQNNAYTGDWLRAGIMTGASSPTATAGSTVSLETGNTKGFWLQGPSDGFAFAATVTVPVTVNLAGYAREFSWCGIASDRPPTAIEYDGYYALHGTPDFIINGTITEPTKAYNKGCIYSLTDSTGCPGEPPAMPTITNFTASTTAICRDGSVTLTATATNAASYSFNNGAWSSSSTTVVKPDVTTNTYTLKVRSAGGCTVTASTTITITVNDPPVPQSLTTTPDVICAGESVTLTAAPAGAASYSLDGLTWTASEQLTDTPTSTTTYTLYIKSAEGCTASLPNAATVTVNDPPAGLSLTSATICNGESTTLTAAPAGEALYRLNSEAWQAANTFSVNPTATTTYTLYIKSAEGCTANLPDAAIVTVNAVPTVTADSPARCGTGAVTLTASPTNQTTPATYTWKVGTAAETTTTSTTYAPDVSVTGTTYSVTVTNDTGCTSAAATGTITVHPAFTSGTITTASGTTSQGTNPNVTIANSTAASGGDGNITYQWRRSGNSSATFSYDYSTYPINNDATNYSTTGTYYFTRYAHDGFCNTAWAASSGQYTLTVRSPPDPPNSSGSWSCGSQVWSGALRNPAACTRSYNLAQSTVSSALYYDLGTSQGYYYNWKCMNENKNQLCPAPWHIPDNAEFTALVNCMGGNNSTGGSNLVNAWGTTGHIYDTTHGSPQIGYLWGSSGKVMTWYPTYARLESGLNYRGYQVRCVR